MSKKLPSATILDVLDVRSYDQVVVLDESAERQAESEVCLPDSLRDSQYLVATSIAELPSEAAAVFVQNCTHVSKFLVTSVTKLNARLICFIPNSIEQERVFRSILAALYPFADSWTFATESGKAIVTSATGKPFDSNCWSSEALLSKEASV